MAGESLVLVFYDLRQSPKSFAITVEFLFVEICDQMCYDRHQSSVLFRDTIGARFLYWLSRVSVFEFYNWPLLA